MGARAWLASVVLLCCLVCGGMACAAAAQPVTLAHTAEFTLHSSATQRDYLIQVALPQAPPPDAGYAVLYVLDGNAYWPLLRVAHAMFSGQGPRARPRPLLIVGVGYPGVTRLAYDARAEDYTPAVPTAKPRRDQREHGGAAQFLTFIRERLQPAVQARYAIDDSRQAIIGHSFGGLFVLYTLLTQPTTFDQYLAISPSLWWGQGNLQHYWPAAQADTATWAQRCVFIGVGESERPGGVAMATHARAFERRLTQLYPALDSTLVMFAGERHSTVMWPAVRRALAYRQACVRKTVGLLKEPATEQARTWHGGSDFGVGFAGSAGRIRSS